MEGNPYKTNRKQTFRVILEATTMTLSETGSEAALRKRNYGARHPSQPVAKKNHGARPGRVLDDDFLAP
jgi:hypothetical protein